MTDAAPLHHAWADTLGEREWHHAVALTTRRAMSPAALLRCFEDRFVRRLAYAARRPVPFFVVAEGVESHPHLHGLIYGTWALSTKQVAERWPFGFSRVTVFDPRRGGVQYAAKSLDAADAYAISRRWPPRRVAVQPTTP